MQTNTEFTIKVNEAEYNAIVAAVDMLGKSLQEINHHVYCYFLDYSLLFGGQAEHLSPIEIEALAARLDKNHPT